MIKVEVFDTNNNLLVSSLNFSVSSDMNENILLIKAPITKELPAKTPVNVIFTFVGDTRTQYSAVVNICTSFQINAVLSSESEQLEEKRRYFKLKVDIPAKIVFDNKDDETEKPQLAHAMVKDINLGGVFLITEFNFQINDKFILMINLDDEILEIPTTILRIQEIKKTPSVCLGYGCSFINVKPFQEQKIAQYINKVEKNRMDYIKGIMEDRNK